MNIAAISSENESFAVSRQQRWHVLQPSPLWICLLLALIARAWLVIHTHGVIDGDEAIVGIQAQHILRGEIPIYYYGQPYMGSLEAYLMALLFAIVGSSVWALRAEPTLLSLLLVWLTWRLAAALAEAAQLPPSAQKRFMTIAALFAAVPPLYDSVIELRTLGGYIEAFVIMLLLLLSALRLTQRWSKGASSRELALRWAGLGILIGLGFWVNPLVISAVLAVAIWLASYFIMQMLKLRQQIATEPQPSLLSLLKNLGLALAAVPASLVGFAPALYWGANNHWKNITYITANGSAISSHQLPTILHVAYLYRTCIAPRIIGGALPAVQLTAPFPGLFTLALQAGQIYLLASILLICLAFFLRSPFLLRMRHLVALPLLFAICTAFIFCISKISVAVFYASCSKVDLVGRYASPLLLALPFLFAAPFTIISIYLQEKGTSTTQHRNEEVSDSHSRPPSILSRQTFAKMAQAALFALLLVLIGIQGYTYEQTNAGYTFQTSGCIIAPANNDPIIAYMRYKHIHYAWASFWIGNPIIFKTGESIILTDPRNITYHRVFRSRLAAYTYALLHAKLPSVLTLIKQNDAHPYLLKVLHARHIKYYALRFYSEPGVDLLLVTPLNRNISPFLAGSLGAWFGGC